MLYTPESSSLITQRLSPAAPLPLTSPPLEDESVEDSSELSSEDDEDPSPAAQKRLMFNLIRSSVTFLSDTIDEVVSTVLLPTCNFLDANSDLLAEKRLCGIPCVPGRLFCTYFNMRTRASKLESHRIFFYGRRSTCL